MKKLSIALFFGFLLGIISAWAIPANPQPIEMAQPDGTMISIKMIGDEYGHYETTEDGIVVVRGEDGFYRYAELSSAGEFQSGAVIARNIEARTEADKIYLTKLPEQKVFIQKFESRRLKVKQAAQTNVEPRAVQATGTVRGLVLLVQFTDEKFTHTNADFTNMMNQEGYNYNGGMGSVRDYFIAQSGGKFTPTFDVYGPFTMSHNEAYYGGDGSDGTHDPNFSDRLPSDLCDAANSSVDFSQYDADGDGYVDLLYIIYAGYGQSSSGNSNDIWPKSGTASTGTFDRWDGKKISRFACSSELKGSSGTTRDGIGTFIHEYSHTLGLPDFYDTVSGATYGMGYWDMMCYGGYRGNWGVGYTAYERAFCGWLNLTELPSTHTSVTLENLADSHKAYRMSSSSTNQYFILENRQKTGWDTYLPGEGLMITKVDYDASIWAPYGAVGTANRVNVDPNRQRMTIVPADNVLSIASESGDLYPYNGNNSFTSTSTPASVTNTAGTIDRPVTHITNNNGVISFLVNSDGTLLTPEITSMAESDGNLVVRWSDVVGAYMYRLQIYRQSLLGGEVQLFKEVVQPHLEYSTWNTKLSGYIYTAQVRAESESGELSAYSTVKSVTIQPEAVPYVVTFSPAVNGTFEVRNGTQAITSGAEVLGGTTLTVVTMPNEGYSLDAIKVNGSKISGNTFMVNGATTVVVTFKEGEEAVEYSTPGGTIHSGNTTYVERIYTEGADKNVDKSWSSAPGNVYQLVDEVVEVRQGGAFNLHLNAYSLGSESSTAVRQDLRYTTAVIFSDWNRDGEFEQEEVYGTNPPAHNVTGNMAVMEINKAFTVPANAPFGESRIRVIYSNAWGEVATANTTSILEGMAYDIVVKVTATSAIDEMKSAYKVYASQGQIVVECEGEQRVEVINLTGQVVLSTVVNDWATLDVPTRGVYLVRCGEKVARVIVR